MDTLTHPHTKCKKKKKKLHTHTFFPLLVTEIKPPSFGIGKVLRDGGKNQPYKPKKREPDQADAC
jgi:hypothetical protein